MKFVFALLALVATSEAVKLEGVPKGDLMKGSHWRKAWPEGTDDSTNDEDVLNWMRKRKGPEPPIQYHDKMRQWQPGTWPVYHTWNKDFDHASYHQETDDGTDDNEVLNMLQVKKEETRTN